MAFTFSHLPRTCLNHRAIFSASEELFEPIVSFQKALTNSLEPYGLFFIMDGCIYFRLQNTPPIHYHYKSLESQDIFKYISDCVHLKEDSHIHLGRLEGE